MALENRPTAALIGLGRWAFYTAKSCCRGWGQTGCGSLQARSGPRATGSRGAVQRQAVRIFVYRARRGHRPGGPGDLCSEGHGACRGHPGRQNQVGPNTVLLSVLNGITSERELAAAFGPEKVLYSVAQGMDAVRRGTALTYTHAGTLALGEADAAPTARLKTVAALLEGCGIACQLGATSCATSGAS